jgi:hypothetical protein
MSKKKTITFKPISFWIADPIFRQRIWILVNYDKESYIKFLTKEKVQNLKEETEGLRELNQFQGWVTTINNKDGIEEYILWVSKFNWTLSCQNTLIHEITHVVMRIFEGNNIPFNIHTQEFIAHSIGNIYESIGERLFKDLK